jgi:hypothetical protein
MDSYRDQHHSRCHLPPQLCMLPPVLWHPAIRSFRDPSLHPPPPSLLSPHANSSEFRNLLKWLRTSSLPKQETSYWPLMHDPCNVLEWLHRRFLFGFALLTPTTPDPLLNESLSTSPPSYTSGLCHLHHLRLLGQYPFLLCRLGYFGLRHLAPPTKGPKKGLDLPMLCKFWRTLDLSDGCDLALWAAIMVGFFSFLWASNLIPRSAQDLD